MPEPDLLATVHFQMMDTIVADALVGRTVDRRYRVEARLAAGGMATVYLATDLRLDRPVALKVMRGSLAEDADFVARFQAEARSGARLSHPNVVAVFDQGSADGLVYLAMEYVPGRTLRQVLQETGPFSPEQALAVLDQSLQALAAAHAAGFVHRDIKPENVLISDSGQIKVTDFGLARALEGPTSATRGMLIGTAAYLAPEQVTDGGGDERTDVYQAGVLLYELLAGTPPHSGDSPWAVAYQHVNEDVPSPSARRPDCPASLDQLVADATRRNPADRIADVGEFLARSRSIAATLPPPVPFRRREPVVVPDNRTTRLERGPDAAPAEAPPTEPPPTRRGSRSGRRGWVLAVMVLASVVALTAGVAWIASVNPFDRTDVPNVVGKPESRATTMLAEAGFVVDVGSRAFSEEVPVGVVIASDPEPDSGARRGATVGITVSLGPERYGVPAVRGKTPADAAAAMTATHLAVAAQRNEYHDTVDPGLVIRTDPPKGQRVKPDTPVTLFVSKGPAPVDVPSVVGQGESSARGQLSRAGLRINATTKESLDVPKGVVMSVKPSAGTSVHRGDTVQLVISEGPPPVAVPNVIDQPREQAVAILEAAGLRVAVDEGVVTPLNRVYSQDPAAGNKVPVGSTVTISIF
jgi:eukaryotic-like serine/threonine-protein kinase